MTMSAGLSFRSVSRRPGAERPVLRNLARISAITVASLGLLALAWAGSSAPAFAAVPTVGNLGACTAETGVAVYVDFSAWPKGKEKGAQDIASASTPGATKTEGGTTTGLDALQAAGFTTDGTVQYGEAFVCRIGVRSLGAASQEPDPEQEPCNNTPHEYWAYWHADAGTNTWKLSGVGAQSYDPYAGSIDAWTFEKTSRTNPPTLSPKEVRTEKHATAVKPALTTTPTSLGNATVGKAYQAALSTSGMEGPYDYALDTNGPALPGGLKLSSSGIVSGTPTAAGAVNFVVDVTAAPITTPNPSGLSPPDGYTGPDLGTIAVHITVQS